MGKYMKRSKNAGVVAVMEVSRPTSFGGVLTRAAKTLALQRLRSHSPLPSANPASASSYLQLRSRGIEKLSVPAETRKQQQQKQHGCEGERIPRAKPCSAKGEGRCGNNEEVEVANGNSESEGFLEGECASFGENSLDFAATDRSTRESTPCNLIRNSETIRTPGSTSRRISSDTTYRRSQENTQRSIPSTHDIEEFFAHSEQQQQNFFIEKYNFDIVNDIPLLGRYEWDPAVP